MADYDGAGSITLSRTPLGAESDEEDGPRRTISLSGRPRGGGRDNAAASPTHTTTPGNGGGGTPSGGTGTTPASGSALSAPRKPRGRPPGSKNKPKPPVVITRESESAMRPLVLELSAGSDVLECVSSFARHRRVGISILSGSGAVTNVTLRHPASHSNTLTLHGRFDILSLSGTFLPTPAAPTGTTTATTPLSSPSSPTPTSTVKSPFTISLAGSQGQVIGGTVAGSLMAVGPVVLLVASFASPEFHRLPAPTGEDEEGDPAASAPAGEETKPLVAVASETPPSSMGMVYNVTGATAISCQIAPEVLPWSSHADRTSAPHFRHSHHPHHHY